MIIIESVGKTLARERDRWLLWTPLAIGSGIVAYFQWPYEPPLWWIGATPLLLFVILLCRRTVAAVMVLVTVLLAVIGFNAGQIETRLVGEPMLDRKIGPTSVTGRLIYTEVMPKGVRLTLKDPEIKNLPPEKTPLKVRVRMQNRTLADVPPTGSVVNVWAELGPFSEPVAPGATDFRWQAYFKQLGGLGWSTTQIRLVDPAPAVPGWRDRFNDMLEHLRNVLTQHVYKYLSGDVAAMTAARLHGEQTGISEPVIEAMRVAGLAHLLSTSGFHVTIMGLLVYFPLRSFFALIPWIALRYPVKKWAAVGAIFSTVGYTLLVGSPAATLRSMIMTGIAMIGVIVDRPSVVMRLVMLSAAIVMMISPDAILGPSFQMSFAAVLCLIAAFERKPGAVAAEKKKRLPKWIAPVWGHLWPITRTSLIATAATTPFSIYHFGTFSFYGFAANALAIPLTSSWVMPCLLISYIAVPLNIDGPFLTAAGWGIEVTIRIALAVASWPYALLHAPGMPGVSLALVIVGGLWLCLWRRRWRWLGLLPVAIGMLYPFYTPKPDFFVTGDGKEWAARLEDGRLAVPTLKKDKFVFEQWQEKLGMPDLADADDLENDPRVRCDDAGCVYRMEGHILAIPKREDSVLEDCDMADIVVAPFVIRQCGARLVIDDPELWRHGAHALYFRHGDVRVKYTRERRGMRPWSVGWKRVENE